MRVVFSGRRGWSDAARKAAAKGRTLAAQKRRELQRLQEEADKVTHYVLPDDLSGYLTDEEQKLPYEIQKPLAESREIRATTAFNEHSALYHDFKDYVRRTRAQGGRVDPRKYRQDGDVVLALATLFGHNWFKASQVGKLLTPKDYAWWLNRIVKSGAHGSYRLVKRKDKRLNVSEYRVENLTVNTEQWLDQFREKAAEI
jgi:hypothetical protein